METVLADNPNVQRKLLLRMEQIARYRVAMLPTYKIAALVGMSEQGLYHLMHRPEYIQVENEVRSTVLEDMDAQMQEDRMRALRRDFDKVIPEVFNTVVQTMRQTKDLRSRMAAAIFLADRDPGRRMVPATRASDYPSVARVLDVQPDTVSFMNNVSHALREAPATTSITTPAAQGPPPEDPGDKRGTTS